MTEPIRILNLFVIMDRGGAEAMVMNYYRSIDRTKVQFDFMVHREQRGEYEDEIEKLGGKVYRMRPIRPGSFHKYEKELDDFFTQHPEYKIIHCNCSELGYYAFKVAKKHNVAVRICHAHSAPSVDKGFMEKAKSIFRNYFKKGIRPLTTDMFVCSTVAGDWLFGKENESRFVMMNNAIDTKKYIQNDAVKERIRKKYNLENKYVIGHVGRFVTAKNHPFILQVFNEVQKKCENARLLLVGKYDTQIGNDFIKKAEELGIKDKIVFTGVVDNVNEMLQSMDLFLFPSLYEGLPVSVIEAQAAGLKCVVSNTITSQCIVTDNVKVMSLETDAEKWADEILKYKDGYTHEDTSKQIADAHFDIEENAKWLQNFYLDKINSSK